MHIKYSSRIAIALAIAGCDATDPVASPSPPLDDGGFVDAASPGRDKQRVDGGFLGPDGGALRPDRFITTVVSFTPGGCGGFGASEMPDIVLGPPVGTGNLTGSLDVVSLGIGGEIVVSFEPNAIVDGPGPDFIVFENAFYAGGDATQPHVDPGEVSVSEDGVTWVTFPCEPGESPPYGACAGWRPVHSAPGNGISPFDVERAGGDPYDLSDVGLKTARFVRIRDKSIGTCDGPPPRPNNSGFDLDAIAIVHALHP